MNPGPNVYAYYCSPTTNSHLERPALDAGLVAQVVHLVDGNGQHDRLGAREAARHVEVHREGLALLVERGQRPVEILGGEAPDHGRVGEALGGAGVANARGQLDGQVQPSPRGGAADGAAQRGLDPELAPVGQAARGGGLEIHLHAGVGEGGGREGQEHGTGNEPHD